MTQPRRLHNAAGLGIELNANCSIHRIDCGGVTLNLFVGNELEGGPANLWLRRHAAHGVEAVALLGPRGPLQAVVSHPADDRLYEARGEWQGLRLHLQLRLAEAAPAWFWHLRVDNLSWIEQVIDLVLVQDVGLSSYAAIRLNEYYVSHYVDLTPLAHPDQGWVLAARQNLGVDGRHPWALVGSLRRGESYATDALQVHGIAPLEGGLPPGIAAGLPGRRLQHEHALLAIQDTTSTLAPGAHADLGFFARVQADHPEATNAGDLSQVAATLGLPEAQPLATAAASTAAAPARSLFASAPILAVLDLDASDVDTLFGPQRRHEEHEGTTLLSFFRGEHGHVVLRAKELRVQRPHGHILRSGKHLVPDETALTSTAWMAGVFHSMVTQGHVSINRLLSTQRSLRGLFRSQGQRIFVRSGGAGWMQLGVPSAFEIEPAGCRWLYKHGGGLIEVRSRALASPHALGLELRVLAGEPLRLLVTHHIALGGDDGDTTLPVPRRVDADGVWIGVPEASKLAEKFASGGFRIVPMVGTSFESVGGDELLFDDASSQGQPFVCIMSAAVTSFGLRITGELVDGAEAPIAGVAPPQWTAPAHSALSGEIARLAEVMPWYLHNALVHYLSPRGLEQFSGGGWGTRDVCQGPLEMLLALDRPEPVRDLLLRVFAAQNPDGDWPQWFTFFERERALREADSHGDIVFWPLLGLARYLIASGDAALLDAALPFFTPTGEPADIGSVWHHVERALVVIQARRIAGTHLAAYGHGDWNDSLQPADPAMRERLCSAWTVTLHHQVLVTLADALHRIGREAAAATLQAEAAAVLADFQRLLVVDGVLTGYALFPADQPVQLLLHPADRITGVRYSLLAMTHAIIDDMLSPAQAREHLALIEAHLTGPDGARLFDRPLPYRGGPKRLFQRAETSAFFGREIGVMYTHAHLRYAEALAHVGDAQRFFDALRKVHPIGLRERVLSASPRQANCYFSSSDAAFADRYEADRDYERVAQGTVALDGGWRIYSSGPGIAIGLVVGSLLGIRRAKSTLVIDPVMPPALDGLRTTLSIAWREIELVYRVGKQGSGPLKLELNGSELGFTRGANPYRVGAAEVSMAELESRLLAAANQLVVYVA